MALFSSEAWVRKNSKERENMGKEEGWECVFVVVLKKNPLGSGLFRLQSTHFNRVWK